jgi:hypothetical protein
MTKASETQVGGDHYKTMGDFQPWDVLKHWLTPEEYRGYQKGVAIAYLARERSKGGAQDIAKAAHHLQKLVEVLGETAVPLPIIDQPTGAAACVEPCCGQHATCTKPCVPRAQKLADADGWIKHDGGPCPVPRGTLVEVRLRNGHIQAGLALHDDGTCTSEPQWTGCDYPSLTIAAYRILPTTN